MEEEYLAFNLDTFKGILSDFVSDNERLFSRMLSTNGNRMNCVLKGLFEMDGIMVAFEKFRRSKEWKSPKRVALTLEYKWNPFTSCFNARIDIPYRPFEFLNLNPKRDRHSVKEYLVRAISDHAIIIPKYLKFLMNFKLYGIVSLLLKRQKTTRY